MSASPFEAFLSTPEMLKAFGQEAIVQAMLDFEAALARGEATLGIIPESAAREIARHCQLDGFAVAEVVDASGRAGSLAIPLVKQLTARVAIDDAGAARYVHWGSTSQDVVDTAMVLATRRALQLIVRARVRIREAAQAALQLQLGGAVGTLSVLGKHGPALVERVAADLGLRAPQAAWHTQRDEWLGLAAQIGLLCGSLGKIARDWSLMCQGEVGELAEPSGGGRGGSSAMPHKRNPVAAMLALAAAERVPHRIAALLGAMPQEHERGLGNWQAELAEWAGLFVSAHGALKALSEASGGLEVDAAKMLHNIDALHGLVYAEALSTRLAVTLGKAKAHHCVEAWSQTAVREQRDLHEVAAAALRADPALEPTFGRSELEALFDAAAAARPAQQLAARQIEALRALWATTRAAL
jgi:3-carboxy-cis,cis-muconate cycloisomerase